MTDYNNNANMGEAMDWDDEFTDDGGEFVILPDGEYMFVITGMERRRFDGSAKMAPCPQADLTLEVFYDNDTRSTKIHDRINVNTKMKWRITQLARALCLEKNPETNSYRVPWNNLVGRQGVVRIKVRTYTNNNGDERQTNDVDRYLAPEECSDEMRARMAPPQAPAQPAPMQPVPVQQPAPVQAAPITQPGQYQAGVF